MPTLRRSFQSLLGIGLLAVLLFVIWILRQNEILAPQTSQEQSPTINEIAQATAPDSPLPTAIILDPIEQAATPLPTMPPPSTPTTVPGPTATAWPLVPPALDATGSIIYPVAEMEIKPGRDANIALYSISMDQAGQPQGEPTRLNGEIQVSGFFATYVSPNGSKILIEDGWGIHAILYTASGKVESPFHDNSNPRGTFFSWHPDSKQILIRAEDNYLDPGLWLVDSDTGQHTTLLALYGTPSILTGGTVAPDGQKVAYSLKRDFQLPSELWITSSNGAEHRQVYSYEGYIVAPAWSPDGRKIAFLGDGLTVINADGTEVRVFGKTAAIGYNFQPVWSPNSEIVAYMTHEQTNTNNPVISKDGGSIDPLASTNIHLVNIVTGEERRLLNEESTGNIDPTWSPDGAQIAFISSRSGATAIWLVNTDGSNLRELPTTNQWIRFPKWGKYPLLSIQQ